MDNIKIFINWLKWCWIFKEILTWQVGLVSFRELSKDEFEYPEIRLNDIR